MNNSKRKSWQNEVHVINGFNCILDATQAFMYFVVAYVGLYVFW